MPVKRINNKQLGELLLDEGVISREQLSRALSAQKDRGG